MRQMSATLLLLLLSLSAPTSILQDGMALPQPSNDVPQFYPVPPSGPPGQVPISGYPPQDPGFAPPPFHPQPEQPEMYPGSQQPCPPPLQMGQMLPHVPQQVTHSPVQMNHPSPQVMQHMPPSPGHMPPVEQLPQPPPEVSSSPPRNSFTPQKDFYDQMARMVSIWLSECLKKIHKCSDSCMQRRILCFVFCKSHIKFCIVFPGASGSWEAVKDYFTIIVSCGAFLCHLF